jgi:hypothetical protein
MAVVAGVRCNPVVRGFYEHLPGQGKPPKDMSGRPTFAKRRLACPLEGLAGC